MAPKGGCWACKECDYDKNWASRLRCFRCQAERSKGGKSSSSQGDKSRPSAWLTEEQVEHFKAMDENKFAEYKKLGLLTQAQIRHLEKQRSSDSDPDAEGGLRSEEDLKAEIAQADKSFQTAQGNYKVHLQTYLTQLRAQLHKAKPAPQQHMSIARQWETIKAKVIKAEEKEKDLEKQLSDLQTKLKDAKKETAALREQAHAQEQLFKQTATQVAGDGAPQMPKVTLETLELDQGVRDTIAPCFDQFMAAMQKFFSQTNAAHVPAAPATPPQPGGGGVPNGVGPSSPADDIDMQPELPPEEVERLLEQAMASPDKRKAINKVLQKVKRFRPA